MRILPTTDADWVSERIKAGQENRERAEARMREESMAAHPAGKFRSPFLDGIQALPPFEEAVFELAYELADTLISKQADYGPKAINDAPGGAALGVLVRAHDKLARLENLYLGSDHEINHESMRDSWLDLAGYAFIGLLLAEGSWPK